jgi:hypothetical protein
MRGLAACPDCRGVGWILITSSSDPQRRRRVCRRTTLVVVESLVRRRTPIVGAKPSHAARRPA